MKILFDCHAPFSLAHGGAQTQIEQTRHGLEQSGIAVEWLRWWNQDQAGDLIHFFGTAPQSYLRQAKLRRIPVVMTTLFTATCNRTDEALRIQGLVTRTLLALPGWRTIKAQISWSSFINCECNIVGLEAEKSVLKTVYGVEDKKIHVVPLGLSEEFLNAGHGSRSEPYLITTGTITDRKRSLELARMAIAARVPVLFVGKPYSRAERYWKEFEALIDNQWVLYREHVADTLEMTSLLKNARGFVLFSRYENWCLSAHEAAACGLPVLLPDQKWSRERFGNAASYLHAKDSPANAGILKEFYERCPSLPPPAVTLFSWQDVALGLAQVYREVLSTSR